MSPTPLNHNSTQLNSSLFKNCSQKAKRDTMKCKEKEFLFNKNAQLSLTNPRDTKPCGKVLQFDV